MQVVQYIRSLTTCSTQLGAFLLQYNSTLELLFMQYVCLESEYYIE